MHPMIAFFPTGAYKVTQLRGGLMKLTGSDDKVIQEEVWDKQHAWAGDQMYKMCIDLRGFYLKVRDLYHKCQVYFGSRLNHTACGDV